jgi:dipeptidyl aminopeptidase/acylaminoacyl peptidase
VLLGLSIAPAGPRLRGDESGKEIADLENKLAELKKKLAELKKTDAVKQRRPIELKDALAWESIGQSQLSRDGAWFAYAHVRPEKKGETIVRQAQGDKEHRFPGTGRIAFSHDSRWMAVTTVPSREESRRRARRDKDKDKDKDATLPEPPASKTILLNLGSGEKVEYEGVTRFAFSGEASTYLAIYKSRSRSGPSFSSVSLPGLFSSGTESNTPARGGDLLLRELATGKELLLGNVAEFAFDKKGDYLALVIDAQGQIGNGVQLRNMKTGLLTQLDSGKASYQGLTWTEKGDGFSVLKGVEDKKYKDKLHSVLAYTDVTSPSPTAIVYDPAKDNSFPRGMTITSSRAPFFAEDLSAVFFGIHTPRKADQPDLTKEKADPTKGKMSLAREKGKAKATDEDKPDLIIWHGSDERLQAQQEKEAGFDRTYSYLCAYRVKEKKFLRLADDTLRSVNLAPKQRFAIGMDDRAMRRSRSLDGRSFQDVYVIDLATGERHPALKQNRYFFGASPDGTHFLYYDDGEFHVYDMVGRKSRCISKGCGTSFINTEDDHPVDRPPTRTMGWTKDSSAVLLSDNWDVWKLPIADGPAVNLTGNGKKESIRYRFRLRLDPDEKGIDLSAPLYFSAMEEWTKKSGIVRIDPKQAGGTKLCWGDAEFGAINKAPGADVFVFTRETTADYPDFYATDSTFKTPRRLTKLSTQQEKFLWTSGSMLVNYESAKGDRLQGSLFLPANYEKGKKYPTVVYIYERLSQMKNRYAAPRGMGFSPSLYTSNGYAVFMPDIKYTVNDPGMSAVWCVLPALQAAIATGVVDKDRVGLHGHSWGGYQTAFLITQTPAFKAAIAGAPLTNLISMYSSVYWNTGWANQPIFESSQGRFTAGYWELQDAYIRNSPVFHARNVVTPLLLLHNDKDGAVDFNQGIEYFNTLRRLNKSVVMLQYKGENHGLIKPANQKDYSRRMREFFDHHLMGKPAPGWLKEGVPHLKMEEHLKERGSGE